MSFSFIELIEVDELIILNQSGLFYVFALITKAMGIRKMGISRNFIRFISQVEYLELRLIHELFYCP